MGKPIEMIMVNGEYVHAAKIARCYCGCPVAHHDEYGCRDCECSELDRAPSKGAHHGHGCRNGGNDRSYDC